MGKTLLLNADYTPIKFISYIKGFVLVESGRAEIFDFGGNPSFWDENKFSLKSVSRTFKVPATIRLLNRVSVKYSKPKFKKNLVYHRDNWTCQYCQTTLSKTNASIDHIFPSSRGGPSAWHNCVAACKTCNRRKANKTPKEAGMPLKFMPKEPGPFTIYDAYQSQKIWHDDWEMFLKAK